MDPPFFNINPVCFPGLIRLGLNKNQNRLLALGEQPI
jgi:hypothetical protein